MIKNIIFDFGNIIVKSNEYKLVSKFTDNEEIKKFLIDEVINSDEWAGKGMIDLGIITLEEAAERINEKTNNIHKDEVTNFLLGFSNKLIINDNILEIIENLRNKGYKTYVLSNTNKVTFDLFRDKLEPFFDGLVLSYEIKMIKPFEKIYEYLLETYNLNPNECIFLDDREENIITANRLEINGRVIKKDDTNDIIKALKEYNLI